MPPQTSQQVLVERLSNLHADITDIKATVSCFGGNLEKLERLYLVEHEKLVGRVDAAFRRIDEQFTKSDSQGRRIDEITNQILKLERSIQPLITTNKVLSWLFGVLGVSVVGLIWSLITGQVRLIFP